MSLRSEIIKVFNQLIGSGKKISELPAASAPSGTELIEGVQGGVNVKFTVSQIGSGGGATAFTDLSDVPSSYSGEGGKIVSVKADETGLEFITGGGGAVDSVNGQTGVVSLDASDVGADAAGSAAAAQSAAQTYADGKVLDSIADSDTTHAPSRNAVFDALALKAALSSPTFTGTPLITTTPTTGDSTHKIADTAFVQQELSAAGLSDLDFAITYALRNTFNY